MNETRYMSEVMRIIAGALDGNERKVRAYAEFLAANLDDDLHTDSARRLRQLLDGGGQLIRIERVALPAGKTCADCRHMRRCVLALGCSTPSSETCDWSPSRFREETPDKEGPK